jgi:hypothetical protein
MKTLDQRINDFMGHVPDGKLMEKVTGCASCFVCGQPFNKTSKVDELKSFIKEEIVRHFDMVVVAKRPESFIGHFTPDPETKDCTYPVYCQEYNGSIRDVINKIEEIKKSL